MYEFLVLKRKKKKFLRRRKPSPRLRATDDSYCTIARVSRFQTVRRSYFVFVENDTCGFSRTQPYAKRFFFVCFCFYRTGGYWPVARWSDVSLLRVHRPLRRHAPDQRVTTPGNCDRGRGRTIRGGHQRTRAQRARHTQVQVTLWPTGMIKRIAGKKGICANSASSRSGKTN